LPAGAAALGAAGLLGAGAFLGADFGAALGAAGFLAGTGAGALYCDWAAFPL